MVDFERTRKNENDWSHFSINGSILLIIVLVCKSKCEGLIIYFNTLYNIKI